MGRGSGRLRFLTPGQQSSLTDLGPGRPPSCSRISAPRSPVRTGPWAMGVLRSPPHLSEPCVQQAARSWRGARPWGGGHRCSSWAASGWNGPCGSQGFSGRPGSEDPAHVPGPSAEASLRALRATHMHTLARSCTPTHRCMLTHTPSQVTCKKPGLTPQSPGRRACTFASPLCSPWGGPSSASSLGH